VSGKNIHGAVNSSLENELVVRRLYKVAQNYVSKSNRP